MKIYLIVTIYYVIINLIALFLFYIDKKKAIKDKYRIPERTLIFMAALGGGIGALSGMLIFRHKTKKNKFKIWVPAFLFVHMMLVLFITFQNNHLVTTYYEYDEPGIAVRIVQVSDLHNAVLWFDDDYIAKKIREENPDIIVITGDIVDSNHTDIEAAINTANKLSDIADTYYVTGNHEYWLSEEELEKLYSELRGAGVTILANEYSIVKGYGRDLALIGVDDKKLTDASSVIKMCNDDIQANYEDAFSLVLAHEPQYIDEYVKAKAELVLTGHAHGGQFVLPGIGAVAAPDQGFNPKYTAGEIKTEETTVIISRGIGNSVIPIRLFNYPEIVVLDIR